MRKFKTMCAVLVSTAMAMTVLTGCGQREVGVNKAVVGDGQSTTQKNGYDEQETTKSGDTENNIDSNRGKEPGWTIFVYMCGSDLETESGAATDDLNEMLDEDFGENVTFVVETGGAETWNNTTISSEVIERYEIKNGDIKKVDTLPEANMGKASTLRDFVEFGENNYNTEHKAMVLWNHGGGSITGVCFDERYSCDSLSIEEIDDAFSGALKSKYDFVGYDACLMASLENANMLDKYADYMIASEELEPGSGWDYTAIGKCIQKDGSADAVKLGKAICDGFYDSCKQIGQESMATLSVVDLSKIVDVCQTLENMSYDICDAMEDKKLTVAVAKSVRGAENYGGNSPSEGYTNMIDLGHMCENMSGDIGSTQKVLNAINSAVVYQVNGYNRANSHGISIYYPLEIQGSGELEIFGSICPSDSYARFVNMMVYGNSTGQLSDYDSQESDEWEYDWSYGDSYDSDDYLDYSSSDNSNIHIIKDMYLDDDNYYNIQIDTESYDYLESVQNMLFVDWYDDGTMYYLGTDNNVYIDSYTGVITDNFQALWPALPDGQLLMFYVVEEDEDYTIYSAPILLNGEETNLRFAYVYDDEAYYLLGAWDGIDDETGLAAKDYKDIYIGDEIVPQYLLLDMDSGETEFVDGEVYKADSNFIIEDFTLPDGDYYYCFDLVDVFGNSTLSDMGYYYVDEDGEIYVE